jgi:hypothetical protein
VFASENGLNILEKSKYVVVDGTFELVEEDMILTILTGLKNDVPIPCAYFLCSERKSEDYELFFRVRTLMYSAFSVLTISQRLKQCRPCRVCDGF